MREGATTQELALLSSNAIVAFRGERGSYNLVEKGKEHERIVAFRGERGSYNEWANIQILSRDCSLPG